MINCRLNASQLLTDIFLFVHSFWIQIQIRGFSFDRHGADEHRGKVPLQALGIQIPRRNMFGMLGKRNQKRERKKSDVSQETEKVLPGHCMAVRPIDPKRTSSPSRNFFRRVFFLIARDIEIFSRNVNYSLDAILLGPRCCHFVRFISPRRLTSPFFGLLLKNRHHV